MTGSSWLLSWLSRFLVPVLLVVALFLLIRGHNEPGGGFIGGLVASTSLFVHGAAFGPRTVRRLLRVDPKKLIVAGIAISLVSGLLSSLDSRVLFTAIWFSLPESLGGEKIGTPLLFDVGVFVAVVGTLMTIYLAHQES